MRHIKRFFLPRETKQPLSIKNKNKIKKDYEKLKIDTTNTCCC